MLPSPEKFNSITLTFREKFSLSRKKNRRTSQEIVHGAWPQRTLLSFLDSLELSPTCTMRNTQDFSAILRTAWYKQQNKYYPRSNHAVSSLVVPLRSITEHKTNSEKSLSRNQRFFNLIPFTIASFIHNTDPLLSTIQESELNSSGSHDPSESTQRRVLGMHKVANFAHTQIQISAPGETNGWRRSRNRSFSLLPLTDLHRANKDSSESTVHLLVHTSLMGGRGFTERI